MKQIFTYIFVTLGVIFSILIIIGVYFFVTDPMNLKPLFFGTDVPKTDSNSTDSPKTDTQPTPSGGFTLSAGQKQALINLGIDPAAVPASISATQEACFINALGEARTAEIKAGAVPSSFEFLKAKPCI